jgi:hypothetical protein
METLKSGDAPALLTNIEVMEILQKRWTSRPSVQDETTTNPQKQKKKNNSLRHAEFIEREVYKYLESSSCSKLNIEDMPTFISKLKQKKDADTNAKDRKEEEYDVTTNQNDDNNVKDKNSQENRTKYGLTNAEILQILNLMPTELVEAHLIVEELHTRLSEEEQEELLQLIRDYI